MQNSQRLLIYQFGRLCLIVYEITLEVNIYLLVIQFFHFNFFSWLGLFCNGCWFVALTGGFDFIARSAARMNYQWKDVGFHLELQNEGENGGWKLWWEDSSIFFSALRHAREIWFSNVTNPFKVSPWKLPNHATSCMYVHYEALREWWLCSTLSKLLCFEGCNRLIGLHVLGN